MELQLAATRRGEIEAREQREIERLRNVLSPREQQRRAHLGDGDVAGQRRILVDHIVSLLVVNRVFHLLEKFGHPSFGNTFDFRRPSGIDPTAAAPSAAETSGHHQQERTRHAGAHGRRAAHRSLPPRTHSRNRDSADSAQSGMSHQKLKPRECYCHSPALSHVLDS